MEKTILNIGGRTCVLYEQEQPEFLLVQPVDEHDLKTLDDETEAIEALSNRSAVLVALTINDWQHELSPWATPPVFGKKSFGDGAQSTLSLITNVLLPALSATRGYDMQHIQLLLGGYSLAGLFALWAGYNSSCFEGIAAASPSVWFPQWNAYISTRMMHAEAVYLSLGDKEEMTRNEMMAQVGTAIRIQYDRLQECNIACTFEWNKGNHFQDTARRTARAFSWLMGNIFHQ